MIGRIFAAFIFSFVVLAVRADDASSANASSETIAIAPAQTMQIELRSFEPPSYHVFYCDVGDKIIADPEKNSFYHSETKVDFMPFDDFDHTKTLSAFLLVGNLLEETEGLRECVQSFTSAFDGIEIEQCVSDEVENKRYLVEEFPYYLANSRLYESSPPPSLIISNVRPCNGVDLLYLYYGANFNYSLESVVWDYDDLFSEHNIKLSPQ